MLFDVHSLEGTRRPGNPPARAERPAYPDQLVETPRAYSMSSPNQLAFKRAFDIVTSLVLLVYLLPVLVLIAIAIKIFDRGPILFGQDRYGKGMVSFRILKFRTMVCDEPGRDFVQATAGDPRITRLGAFLRRTSLDELPQLWNVLVGHMSLVGPRPHATAMEEQIFALYPDAVHRLDVHPGMTGLAQIRGHRGPTASNADLRARIDADLDYVRTWSFGLDMMILVRTPYVWLTGKNAF
jgi:putative colanic acid biosynthesis UDP-glucose lipid carrier transferase